MTLRALIWCAVSTTPQADETERFSLPAQESDALELAQREGWQVVEVLRVPGHSRSYRSLETLAADARQKGIDAFDRLIYHLEHGDFDVLICRDADRFARKASLLHLIVETIIEDVGARIFSFADGWIDSENADIFAMVKGYTTAKEIKRLVKYRHQGMRRRAERGLNTGSSVAFPYRIKRDDLGREIGVEPDRSVQHIVDDAVTLLLEGVPWRRMERELFERFGHGRGSQPFSDQFLQNMFFRPIFHGHMAYGVISKDRSDNTRMGLWMFDPSERPPEGVYRILDTHEPYYTGHKADQVQSELRRRRGTRGRNNPSAPRAFSSLIICGDCTYNMVFQQTRTGFQGYRCMSRFLVGRPCHNRGYINIRTVRAWLDPRLRQLLAGGDIAAFINHQAEAESDEMYLEALRADVVALEAQAREMVVRRVPPALQIIYEQEMADFSVRLEAKQAALAEAERRLAHRTGSTAMQNTALTQLAALGIDHFWEQSDLNVNQVLHALLGDYRLVALHKQIIRIAPRPPHIRKKS